MKIMDVFDIMDIMEIMDKMNITDLVDLIDIMKVMNITAWWLVPLQPLFLDNMEYNLECYFHNPQNVKAISRKIDC